MKYVLVSSSNIAAVGYDLPTNTLGIRFTNGSEYEYLNVPASVHAGLMSAQSVGRYLNSHVKNSGYQCRRIR